MDVTHTLSDLPQLPRSSEEFFPCSEAADRPREAERISTRALLELELTPRERSLWRQLLLQAS